MLQKTIQRKVGNPETVRLYKFSSNSEMNDLIADYKQNFSRSVTILDNGRFNKAKTTFINSLATENWDDLHIVDTDYFLLTREDLAIKDADEKRKNRLAKRGIAPLNTSLTLSPIKPFKAGRKNSWTTDEIAKLYTGTITEVANTLGKSYSTVYLKRKEYETENPTFVVPECATRPVAKKVVKEKPAYKQIVSELSQAEVDILWSNSSAELRAKYAGIFQSIFVIAAMRNEYCKMNPDFVIPLCAKFTPNGLPNKVEQKVRANAKAVTKLTAGLTEDQMSVIWDGSGKEVGAIINKHSNAIYHARIAYCKANPDFIIPAISGFKRPLEVKNAIEIAPLIQPTTVSETIVVQETPAEDVTTEITEQPITPEVTQPTIIEQAIGRTDRAQPKPEQAIGRTDRAQPQPEQAIGRTDRAQPQPEQAIGRTDRAQPQPEQAIGRTDRAQPQPEQAIGRTDRAQPQSEQPAPQQNTMAEMFALLTASGMKPKKATFKNGEVSFEF